MSIIRYQPSELASCSPFDRLASLREDMNRLFDVSLPKDCSLFSGWSPAMDVHDDTNEFTVLCELPGMKKEEIELSVQDGTLLISGERKGTEGKEGETFRSERAFGKFQRTITLPANVNASEVKATYQDGVLTVHLPKTEEAKPKHIEVSVS